MWANKLYIKMKYLIMAGPQIKGEGKCFAIYGLMEKKSAFTPIMYMKYITQTQTLGSLTRLYFIGLKHCKKIAKWTVK